MTQKAGQLCPSRRKLLLSTAWAVALAGGGMILSSGETTQAQQKVGKELVQYQDSPKDGKKCSECALFVKPNACSAVEGEISPEGWCQLWTKAS